MLLLMDSLTRFAHGQREVGLAIGEPPTTKGYTPSVFALLEAPRAGRSCDGTGAISGVYTIFVEGDDLSDPVADSAARFWMGISYCPAIWSHGIISRRSIFCRAPAG